MRGGLKTVATQDFWTQFFDCKRRKDLVSERERERESHDRQSYKEAAVPLPTGALLHPLQATARFPF